MKTVVSSKILVRLAEMRSGVNQKRASSESRKIYDKDHT